VGTTKKTTDWLGREKEVHYDDRGNKVGETRFTTDWLGKSVQEHVDAEGKKTGETRAGKDWLGRDRAEHYDNEKQRVGTSRDENDWLGRPVQSHHDGSGVRVGKTRRTEDWLGRPFKRHEGEYFKARDVATSSRETDSDFHYSPSVKADSASRGRIALIVIVVATLGIFLFMRNKAPSPSGTEPGDSVWYPGGNPDNVPVAIKKILDLHYPGWSFPVVLGEDLRNCRQPNAAFAPGLVWGDFDGDGLTDYAVAIQRGGKLRTLAFLARGDGFVRYVLNPSGWNILGVTRRGATLPRVGVNLRGDLVGERPVVLSKDALIGIHCESSSVAFVYEKGGFQHFFMSD
jgi:hypothetical protein